MQVFPKLVPQARSTLVLKAPKTDDSFRKQYLTAPLLEEILGRIAEIQKNKEFLGPEYHDYGLLICQPDGKPIEPNSLCAAFRKWQTAHHISDQIDFQGLRKSGQMHKVRLTKNNYQLVAENSGQSPEVLMSNYNEILDSEKRDLSNLVESDLYPDQHKTEDKTQITQLNPDSLLAKIKSDPAFSKQILQLLLDSAATAI